MDIYYTIFLVDETNGICYLEEKEMTIVDNFEKVEVLLESKKVLNTAKTLKDMGYEITFVKKIFGTLNEYEIQAIR